jgi:DNA replication protein DnaC
MKGIERIIQDFRAGWNAELAEPKEQSERLAIEAAKRQERILRAGIPKRYQWCTFKAIKEHGIPPKLAENYAIAKAYSIDLERQMQAGHGLLLTGPCGQLKTTMACAIALKAIASHHSAFFVSMPELLNRLLQEPQDGSFLAKVRDRELVILDDLGMEYQSKKSDWMKGQVDSIITYRYNELKPTIITTNLGADQIIQRYDTRFFDRLRDSCYAIISGGDSTRETLNTKEEE